MKLIRVPLRSTYGHPGSLNNHTAKLEPRPLTKSIENEEETIMSGEGSGGEFAYHLDIIEDLNDDRVHSFEDNEAQPRPYDGVELAGIREDLPIFQISKIFYADTGKILNIGSQGETNSPVLLLKRDINALPPRKMMGNDENNNGWVEVPKTEIPDDDESTESQDDIDQQVSYCSARR